MLSGLSLAIYLHKVFFADLTGQQDRATLFGLISTLVSFEGALSLIAGGELFKLNPHYPFIFSCFCFLAAIIVLKKYYLMLYKNAGDG